MDEHPVAAWAGVAQAACLAYLFVSCVAACGGRGGPDQDGDPNGRFVPSARRDDGEEPIAVDEIDKIDLLFVIDDSGSMREEQALLAAQLPRVARALTSGDVDEDGVIDFPPPQDVQFGVISPDMGNPGVSGIERCSGLGDDGLLQPPTTADACRDDVPAFVRYQAPDGDLEGVARDFACLADLGTDGCGNEQPLEAALKALWPSADERVWFHGLTADAPTTGHGDRENAGFSRAEPGTPSLLVIVLITDEDDCSAADTSIFEPPQYLLGPDAGPNAYELSMQGLNVRCPLNPDRLYPVERYVNALSFLREGAPQLVMFAAFAGVPPDRVDGQALAELDYADPDARDAFYRELLDDPRMQLRIDTSGTPSSDDDTLEPLCETASAKAYPARRIVQLAQGFGENGLVQAICQDDLAAVLSALLGRIAHRMRNPMDDPMGL